VNNRRVSVFEVLYQQKANDWNEVDERAGLVDSQVRISQSGQVAAANYVLIMRSQSLCRSYVRIVTSKSSNIKILFHRVSVSAYLHMDSISK
jgi:hypothetical protein